MSMVSCSKCWDTAAAARDSRFCTSGQAIEDFPQRRSFGILQKGNFETGACHQDGQGMAWEEDPPVQGMAASAVGVSEALRSRLLALVEWQGALKDPLTEGKAVNHGAASDCEEEGETHNFPLKALSPARSCTTSCRSSARCHRWSADAHTACRSHSPTAPISVLIEVFPSAFS